MRFFICITLFLATGLCFAGPEQPSKKVFTDLDEIQRHPLELDGKLGSVLIFFWQDCPVSNSYVPELNRIAATHTNFSFYIVQVDPELTRHAAKEHARKFDLHMPVLLDPQHELVKFTQATITPEAVVIGKNGEVLYRGRIDDGYASFGKKRATVVEHDLIDVLDTVTAGKPVLKMETKAIGCYIQ